MHSGAWDRSHHPQGRRYPNPTFLLPLPGPGRVALVSSSASTRFSRKPHLGVQPSPSEASWHPCKSLGARTVCTNSGHFFQYLPREAQVREVHLLLFLEITSALSGKRISGCCQPHFAPSFAFCNFGESTELSCLHLTFPSVAVDVISWLLGSWSGFF